MKNLKPITLPALVHTLTAPAIAEAIGCDRGTPNKWVRLGTRPWYHLDALQALAAKHGFTVIFHGVQK